MDPAVPAQFKLVNQRGIARKILVDDLGYTYSNSNSRSKGEPVNTWRCSKKNKKCKASITTDNDWVISKKHLHNHAPPEFIKNLESDDFIQ